MKPSTLDAFCVNICHPLDLSTIELNFTSDVLQSLKVEIHFDWHWFWSSSFAYNNFDQSFKISILSFTLFESTTQFIRYVTSVCLCWAVRTSNIHDVTSRHLAFNPPHHFLPFDLLFYVFEKSSYRKLKLISNITYTWSLVPERIFVLLLAISHWNYFWEASSLNERKIIPFKLPCAAWNLQITFTTSFVVAWRKQQNKHN